MFSAPVQHVVLITPVRWRGRVISKLTFGPLGEDQMAAISAVHRRMKPGRGCVCRIAALAAKMPHQLFSRLSDADLAASEVAVATLIDRRTALILVGAKALEASSHG
jgi:hypothetical protein